jgi:succinoglycan biosynthesis protein ExoO
MPPVDGRSRQRLLDLEGFPAGKARRGGDRDLWLRTILKTPCVHSGAITATYHRDADNMLTRAESFSVRQRVQDTVVELLPIVDARTGKQLRRLSNREVFQYAFKAWKGGAPITGTMLDGFAVRANPGRYAVIKLMRTMRLPFSQNARAKLRGLFTAVRKRQHGTTSNDR